MLTIFIQLVICLIWESLSEQSALQGDINASQLSFIISRAIMKHYSSHTHLAGVSFPGLPSPLHPAAVVVPLFNRRTRVSQGFQHNQGPDPLQSPHAQKRFLPGVCLILFSFAMFSQVLNREANLSC